MNWINLAQMGLIAIVCWFFYKSFIKNTASERLVHGLFGLALLWVGSFVMNWLHLYILAGFLHWTSLFLSVGLLVIFQPELRKFLALMGNVKLLKAFFSSKVILTADHADKINNSITELVKSIEYMSHKHTGALILFLDKSDDDIIERKGIIIDAKISSELLLTIFFDKTPLHDGALIIENNRIVSAGAILPLTQKAGLNWKHGTRHRAALGMSEASPKSTVLVVSEETGTISIAENGNFKKYEDMKKLKSKLEKVMKL